MALRKQFSDTKSLVDLNIEWPMSTRDQQIAGGFSEDEEIDFDNISELLEPFREDSKQKFPNDVSKKR
jgi:hypothetical protein